MYLRDNIMKDLNIINYHGKKIFLLIYTDFRLAKSNLKKYYLHLKYSCYKLRLKLYTKEAIL